MPHFAPGQRNYQEAAGRLAADLQVEEAGEEPELRRRATTQQAGQEGPEALPEAGMAAQAILLRLEPAKRSAEAERANRTI